MHLRNLLKQQFGVGFVASKIHVQFHECSGKEVCQVDIDAASEPLIVQVEDNSGHKEEKFYVRSGNSSPEMPMSEMSSYIKERFHS